jgi:hypothetical protein
MPTATTTVTAEDLLKRYADDIAYVAEEAPATTIGEFIDQLDTAAPRYDTAGINGHEDLVTASTLLGEALHADDDAVRSVFLKRADDLLGEVWDMVGDDEE